MTTEANAERSRLLQIKIIHFEAGAELAYATISWLIEQAERAQELEKLLEGNDGMSVKEIRAQFVDMHQEVLKFKRLTSNAHEHVVHTKQEYHKLQGQFMTLEDENAKLREALEFYADKNSYGYHLHEYEAYKASVMDDGGVRARQALKSEGP